MTYIIKDYSVRSEGFRHYAEMFVISSFHIKGIWNVLGVFRLAEEAEACIEKAKKRHAHMEIDAKLRLTRGGV